MTAVVTLTTIAPGLAFDFTQFWIIGKLPVSSVHDPSAIRAAGAELLPQLDSGYFQLYLRPAVFALPFRLLSKLDYLQALRLFAGFQIVVFGIAAALLVRIYNLPPRMILFCAVFAPAVWGPVTGQDPNSMLLIVCASLALLRKRRDGLGGAVLALGTYKFHLALLLATGLAVAGRKRALAAFAAVAGVLAFASVLLSPLSNYRYVLENQQAYTPLFSPARMISVRALAISWDAPAVYLALAPLILASSLYAFRALPLERAFAIGCLGTLLAGYYVNWYDATLALPAAAVAVRSRNGAAIVLAAAVILGIPLWADEFRPILNLVLAAFWMVTVVDAFLAGSLAEGNASIGRRREAPHSSTVLLRRSPPDRPRTSASTQEPDASHV